MWTAATLVDEDRQEAADLVLRYPDENTTTRSRIVEQFRAFYVLNNLQIGDAFLLFVGQCRRCTLRYSTILTYCPRR